MANIAHTIPAGVSFLEGSSFGVTRPGLQVTQYETGPFKSRDWFGYNVATYNLKIGALDSTTTEEWRSFLGQVNAGGNVAWIVEPASSRHYGLICGPIADGSQTTFCFPVVSPSDSYVFDDGAKASGYSVRSAANLLSDSEAECSSASDWSKTNAVASSGDDCVLDGISSLEITPNGLGSPRIISVDKVTVVEGREYTARASIMCTGSTLRSWRMEIWWYKDSGGTHVSTSSGTLTECPAGTWTDITVTATAPSATPDTDRALVAIYRQQDTDTNSVFMDCVALCPGDYDRWHLPSQSPGLIEFSSAPSSGARITANVTGARVARVVIDPNRLSWQMRNSDKAYPSGLIATEAPEF